MSCSLKYAGAVCVFATFAFTGLLIAAPSGFLEGNLKILATKEEAGAEAMEPTLPNGASEAYAECPLVVLSQGDQKQIALVTAKGDGSYRVALPVGNYILDLKDSVARNFRTAPQLFSIQADHTTRVNMVIIAK